MLLNKIGVTKMISNETATEISVILDNISDDILKKIPSNIIKSFKDNISDSYVFTYDKTKTLNEQNLKPQTKGVLAFLYKEYICDESSKEEFEQIYREHIINKEQQKIAFEPEKLFVEKNNNPRYTEALPTECISEKWHVKILRYIKKIFKK